MTPTQKGRRSDALYMDTRTTHRRQLCDMVVNREADIEDLKEEMYGLQCDIGRLENENAKLRELLQRLLAEYRYMRVRPRKVYMQHEGRMRVIEEEMRELGIEVD